MITWGYGSYGGDSSAAALLLRRQPDLSLQRLCGTEDDGSVITWGTPVMAAIHPLLPRLFFWRQPDPPIISLCGTEGQWPVITSGDGDYGGDSSAVASSSGVVGLPTRSPTMFTTPHHPQVLH